jgi:hypothetical protein
MDADVEDGEDDDDDGDEDDDEPEPGCANCAAKLQPPRATARGSEARYVRGIMV